MIETYKSLTPGGWCVWRQLESVISAAYEEDKLNDEMEKPAKGNSS